jgi:hypothetical protein
LERQFRRLERDVPFLRRPLATIRTRGWWVVRVPLGLAFLLGGVLAILPVFGLWMIPVGLLLLAVDVAPLRPAVSALLIRVRRKFSVLRRRIARWRTPT